MAIHWQVKFRSLRANTLYTVSIYDDNYSGSTPVQLKGGEHPFTTEEDNDDDFFTPVRTQSGYLRIVDDGKDASGNTLAAGDRWDKMIPTTDRSRKVILTDGNNKIKWQGYLQPQTFTGKMFDNYQEREFPVFCALSVLEGIEAPTNQYGMVNFAFVLNSILTNTGIVYNNIWVQGKDCLNWLKKKVDWENFIQTDTDGNRTAKYNLLGLLEEVCKFWGWSCRTCGDQIYFTSADEDFDVDFIKMDAYGFYDIAYDHDPQYNEETWSYWDTDDDIYASEDNNLEITRGIKKATVTADFNKQNVLLEIPFDEIKNKFRGKNIRYNQQGNTYRFYIDYMFFVFEDANMSIECYYDQDVTNGWFSASSVYEGSLSDLHNIDFTYKLNVAGNLNEFIKSCFIMKSKAAHSFNDGVITINASFTDIYHEPAYVYAFLKIGNKAWDGSNWVSASSNPTFAMTVQNGKIVDNRTWDSIFDNYTGHGIPVDGIGGIVEFRIVKIYVATERHQMACTSLKIGFAKTSSASLNNDKSENVYTELTNTVFTEEQSVDLIFATNNANDYGFGFVMDEDGAYIQSVPYSFSSGLDYLMPEAELLARLIRRGSTIKKKEVIDIRHDAGEMLPSHMCMTPNIMDGYPVSINHDWRDDIDTVTILEI